MYDCIVIGSGPAGLMAALLASKKNKVLLIEKNKSAGKKLLITGGGRCNVTNLKDNNLFLDEVNYNKKYLYSTINNFGPSDIYKYFIDNGCYLKKEQDDRIFPVSDKAEDILNVLLNNAKKVDFKFNETVTNIIDGSIKEVITNKDKYLTKNIVIATGGSSFKGTGSSGDNIKFAKMLNQPIVPIYPAETSVILEDKLDLAGISFEKVEIKTNQKSTSGNLIFTHMGLSGEAIMKLSEHIYKNKDKVLYIDFLPEINSMEIKEKLLKYDRNKEIISFLTELFSKRFSHYLVEKSNLKKDMKIKSLSNKDIETIISNIKRCEYKIKRVSSLDTAYVTGGGVDMKYINSKTMESTLYEGVYFVGEALDIHGPIGGYNITLALSTGYTAGINIRSSK